jgi:hypothetical protein
VTLSWVNQTAQPQTSITVTRTNNLSAIATIIVLPGSATNYVDTTTAVGATYTYSIVASNGLGSSATPSTTSVAVYTPVSVNAFAAVISAGPNVKLTWTYPSSGVGSYIITRTSSVSNTVTTNIVAGNLLTFTDAAVPTATGVTYTYSIVATNGLGKSAAVTVTAGAPATPTGVVSAVTKQGTTDSILLFWNASTNATGYIVQRVSTADGTATPVGVAITLTGVNANTTNITRLAKGTYYYQVTATGLLGNSLPTTTITVVAN